MGNVLSLCTNEISNVFRNCRSQKSEEEIQYRRNFESQDQCSSSGQRLSQAEIGFSHSSQCHSPAESRRGLLGSYSSRIEDDWLPECDQSHETCHSQSPGAGFDRDFPPEPVISKEYIIQTYRISKPEDHVVSGGKKIDCLQHICTDTDRQPQGSIVDIHSLSKEQYKSEESEEKTADNSDFIPQQRVEKNSINKMPICSEFKPKKAGDSCAFHCFQQKTVGEIATESYLSHLKWKKEMDAAGSCVQSKPLLTKREKVYPKDELQPVDILHKKWIPWEEMQQQHSDKFPKHMSVHSHMKQTCSKTGEIIDFLLKSQETDMTDSCVLSPSEQHTNMCDDQAGLKCEIIFTESGEHCQSETEVNSKLRHCVKTESGKESDISTHYNLSLTSKAEKEPAVVTVKGFPLYFCYFDTNQYSGTSSLNNVSESDPHTVPEKSGGEEQVPERIRKLEQRQEKVLQELQKLQQGVQSLAQERGVNLAADVSPSTGAAVVSQSQRSPLQNGKLHDLVISADPSSVPLSLLVLLKQLSKQCEVLTTTFVHSSATDTPEKLRSFLHNGPQAGSRNDYQLAISVVWKRIRNSPSLMISPTRQTCIEGEANIARYLSRLLHPAYDSDDIITSTQIDEILDISQLQILRGNKKEQSAAVRTLNARLGKRQWLGGSTLSVADVVAWSAIQEAKLAGDAPDNVKKWLKACSQNELFQDALKFLPS